MWIDTWQDDATCPDRHYLVKFARNDRKDVDRDILRSEYVYHHALARLGIETVPIDGMFLEEGAAGPSLWLNVVFGDTDNHGRNIAVSKTESDVRLAPVFDFAPMKMDPDGIIRSTRWARCERGDVNWRDLLRSFGPDEEPLRAELGAHAERLADLSDMLASLHLPERTMRFPALDLRGTPRKLRAWGLL